jgi:hypothetical protein
MSNLLYPTLPGLTWPVGRSPVYSTGVQSSTSGREVRLSTLQIQTQIRGIA